MMSQDHPDLHAVLDLPTQTDIMVGAGSSLLLVGWCFHRHEKIRLLHVLVGDHSYPVEHSGLVRPDVMQSFPDIAIQHNILTCGFRTVVPFTPIQQEETVEIRLQALLVSGETVTTPVLKHLHLKHALSYTATTHDALPLIAICLLTYNSDETFLQQQVASIRAQSYPHWLCLVQDDASDARSYDQLCAYVGDDARFQVARNAHNLGVYHNCETVLSRVPPQAQYVVLASDDNIWQPNFLQTFLEAFTADTTLVTGDMRVIDGAGRLVSSTFWDKRLFEAESLDRLLMANTVSGAAMMLRRDLLAFALPFPPAMSEMYDDHWLAVVALACGSISYVATPQLDFRQHGANEVGWVNIDPIDTTLFSRRLRTWTHNSRASAEWLSAGLTLSHEALFLTKKRLWADVLLQRIPHMRPAMQQQLERYTTLDRSPRALQQWHRERSVPRLTLNVDAMMLYAHAAERLLSHTARRRSLYFHLAAQHPSFEQPLKQLRTRAKVKSYAWIPRRELHDWVNTALAALDVNHIDELRVLRKQFIEMQNKITSLNTTIQAQQARIENLTAVSFLPDQATQDTLQRELDYIRSRQAWRLIQRWYALKAHWLPSGSRRERAYHRLRSAANRGLWQALKSLIKGGRHSEQQNDRPKIAPDSLSQRDHDTATRMDWTETRRLHVALDQPTQPQIIVGAASAILVKGWAFHTHDLIAQLTLVVDDTRLAVTHFPLVRADVAAAHSRYAVEHNGVLNSGFRVRVPLQAVSQPQIMGCALEATLVTGERVTYPLPAFTLRPTLPRPSVHVSASAVPLVVICMATYQPNQRFFQQQIDSIRAQTYPNWLCLIQDDASDETAWAMIQRVVGDDARFIPLRNAHTLGIYHNFEACLQRVPVEAAYVAFADQDDVWEEEKIARLVAALNAGGVFAYSDQTIINERGRVLSETGWIERRHQETDIDRLLMTNHIAGSACLFRAALLSVALPFPPLLTDLYHDHWMAAVALTQGDILFVETPLIRYRQHGGNAIAWANMPPLPIDDMAEALRTWLRRPLDSPAPFDFLRMAELSSSIAVWADVLLRRAPSMSARIAAQLDWILRMEGQPHVLHDWMRERGGVPRITLNNDWRMLYGLVAEQVLRRAAQRLPLTASVKTHPLSSRRNR